MALILPKSIYVHLMKTAGWSVRVALVRLNLAMGEIGRSHDPACLLPTQARTGRYIFVFIRHPLSWYRSYWSYRMQFNWKVHPDQEITGWQTFGSVLDHECRANDFETWMRNVLAFVPEGFLSRIYRIYTEGVDFVGKVESFQEDFIRALTLAGEEFSPEVIRSAPKRNPTRPELVKLATLPRELAEKVMASESYIIARWGYDSIPDSIISAPSTEPIRFKIHNKSCRSILDRAARAQHAPPQRLAGRGIIIWGGGVKYFPSAWVCINMLRRLGSKMSIQLWHLGKEEMSDEMAVLLKPLNVQTVDAQKVAKRWRLGSAKRLQLKAFAIMQSEFKEVLLLDADNVPTVNPDFLFDTPEYKVSGSVFWPDRPRLGPGSPIWALCGVERRHEPDLETGQLLVDKVRCWKVLQVVSQISRNADVYSSHLAGDQDIFHIAFRRVGQEYAMPATPARILDCTICQHDFAGQVIFQHRNGDKWSLSDENKRIAGFTFEEECLGYLEELKKVCYESASKAEITRKWETERKNLESLILEKFQYKLVQSNFQPVAPVLDGTVGDGTTSCQVFYDAFEQNGLLYLDLFTISRRLCKLQECRPGVWKADGVNFQMTPIELEM